MLMVLGGPPRCGKTSLARQVASEAGTGWVSTDTIRDVVNMLLPELYRSGGPGVAPDAEADLFFPYFEQVAESCSYLAGDYLIEGVGFLPRHVTAVAGHLDLRAVFVGNTRVDLDTVLATEGRNRWHRELDAATLRKLPAWIEAWSRQLERECDAFGVPYVELGADFPAGIARAKRLLLGESTAARG